MKADASARAPDHETRPCPLTALSLSVVFYRAPVGSEECRVEWA